LNISYIWQIIQYDVVVDEEQSFATTASCGTKSTEFNSMTEENSVLTGRGCFPNTKKKKKYYDCVGLDCTIFSERNVRVVL